MSKFFEMIKLLFFFFAIFIGIFFLRGQYFLSGDCTGETSKILCMMSNKTYDLFLMLLMPCFLIICGIMIGYVIATIWIVKKDAQDQAEENKIYIKSFLIGLAAGLILSLVYILS